MSDIFLNRAYGPIITTGAPSVGNSANGTQAGAYTGPSFEEILSKQLAGGVTFSKHAANRVIERNIKLDDENLLRIGEGVKLAREKGLDDALILLDSSAYLVSAKNGTIITAVGGEDLKGNVFTNIDGAVIV